MSDTLRESDRPGVIGITPEDLDAWDKQLEEEPRPITIYSWGIQFGDPKANFAAWLAAHPECADPPANITPDPRERIQDVVANLESDIAELEKYDPAHPELAE